jgi:hypothetical protein
MINRLRQVQEFLQEYDYQNTDADAFLSSSYNKVVVILVPLQGLYAILLIDTVD